MKEVEVIILAGGEGIRMGDLSQTTQKCLVPIAGRPILSHILDELVNAFGSADVKLGVAYRADAVK